MFIPKKRPEGWSFIALGIFFCAMSLVLLFEVFGPLPTSGRSGTWAVVGVPLGAVAIIIGIVKLVRHERAQLASDTGADDPTGDEPADDHPHA